jgi:hypothetical protein
VLTVFVFLIGKKLRKIEIFKILAVFELTIFLFNCIQTSVLLISKNIPRNSESDYKTSFYISPDSSSPNIYWFFMDGMLGFKAMEYFFNDPQNVLETQLVKWGFKLNHEAAFESGHATAWAIPSLMSPFFYDRVVFPVMNTDSRTRSEIIPKLIKLSVLFNEARVNNELILAFNAKNYQTNLIGSPGFLFSPYIKRGYISGGKIENINSGKVNLFEQLHNLNELMGSSTVLLFLTIKVTGFLSRLQAKQLVLQSLETSNSEIQFPYGDNHLDKNVINYLTDIFTGKEPQLSIIHDSRAHYIFDKNEDGRHIVRTEAEGFNMHNYPPQHRYTRKYLIALIDFIAAHDPDAVIVVQADHGLHAQETELQFLSSGGSVEEARLMQNQTISAVRIPEKWGALEAPLDPLNITRLLVNRYVGDNYELLETHP